MELTAGKGAALRVIERGRTAGEGDEDDVPAFALLLSSLSTNLVDYGNHMAWLRGCQPHFS
jgi:hypothetical protein